MNTMNKQKHERGLKEKLIKKVGDHLAEMAVDPRGCFVLSWYEPDLDPEMIKEMMDTE